MKRRFCFIMSMLLMMVVLACSSDDDVKPSICGTWSIVGYGNDQEFHTVTMFAKANAKVRLVGHHSRGLRAPCREAPPRCFS